VTENLPGLARSLLQYLASREVEMDPAVLPLLARYPWPGNVRELRNVLERALVMSSGRLAPEHFQLLVDPVFTASVETRRVTLNLADLESGRIQEAMTRFGGDTRQAAEALGISRATLYRRLSEMKKA
jgi:DNA-binding NtrC family response regulator